MEGAAGCRQQQQAYLAKSFAARRVMCGGPEREWATGSYPAFGRGSR